MNITVRTHITNNGTLYLKGCYADELTLFRTECYRVVKNSETSITIFPSDGTGRKVTKHYRSFMIHVPVECKSMYDKEVLISYDYDEKYDMIYTIHIEVMKNEKY